MNAMTKDIRDVVLQSFIYSGSGSFSSVQYSGIRHDAIKYYEDTSDIALKRDSPVTDASLRI